MLLVLSGAQVELHESSFAFFSPFPLALSSFSCSLCLIFNTKYKVFNPFRVEIGFWKVEEEALGDWTWKGRVEKGNVVWMRV